VSECGLERSTRRAAAFYRETNGTDYPALHHPRRLIIAKAPPRESTLECPQVDNATDD